MTEVSFTKRISTGTTVQVHEFTERAAAERFYERLRVSVLAGNTIGATLKSGRTRRSVGVMSDKQPYRFQTVKCRKCHDWQPDSMVFNGVCELCEAGEEVFAPYDQRIAFFNTKRRAEYFCKALQKKRTTAFANRPVKGLNERGEKSWLVVYALYREEAVETEAA